VIPPMHTDYVNIVCSLFGEGYGRDFDGGFRGEEAVLAQSVGRFGWRIDEGHIGGTRVYS
jgi:hypothetical protein